MRRMMKRGAALMAGMMLAGCVQTVPGGFDTLPKGSPVAIRTLIAENPGKLACIEYQSGTNSCASLVSTSIRGDVMTTRETGAVRSLSGASVERVNLVSRLQLRDGAACARAEDIRLADPQTEGAGLFLLEATRLLLGQFGGGVCTRYFEGGDDYIVSSVGFDGRPFPPGDVAFRFVAPGSVSLRPQ
ncbi:hypothetical protein [Sulfitobacter sp. S190]|uniref:hypothetical protein n=1 Tax=Sulfitobacter sp. S190 TaxID=2867022 RepID=UPI0021A9359D|nr:hypothetical protein [Sulfitobacter sp. S190]UWR23596.1 hypothetical protein K3756_06405 [Sulfitobacter sp. S190]